MARWLHACAGGRAAGRLRAHASDQTDGACSGGRSSRDPHRTRVRMPAMAHRMRVCARLGVCVCTSARVGVTRRGHTQCACVRSRTDMEVIDTVRLSLCSEHERAGAKLPLDGCSLPPCSSLASKPAVAVALTVASRSLPSSHRAHAHRWCTVCATCIACARRLQSAFKLAVALGRIDAALLLLDSPITAVEAESPSRLQLRHTCLACAVETCVHTRSGPANKHTHTRARARVRTALTHARAHECIARLPSVHAQTAAAVPKHPHVPADGE